MFSLTAGRSAATDIRQRDPTIQTYDDIVAGFGTSVVSYWKFQGNGNDQKNFSNTTLQGGPELNVPTIVRQDDTAGGASSDGTVIAWSGSAGEFAQVTHKPEYKTLNASIVVSFQCDALTQISTLIAANFNTGGPAEMLLQVNLNGAPQMNLRNNSGVVVTLLGQAGDVDPDVAYTIIAKHGTPGMMWTLYTGPSSTIVRRMSNLSMNTGQAASLSPIRFGAWFTNNNMHDGPYGRVMWINRYITDAEELLLARPKTIVHA